MATTTEAFGPPAARGACIADLVWTPVAYKCASAASLVAVILDVC